MNEKICYDNIEKVLKIIQLNRYGEIDDNISFVFAPLWEMDERERQEINKIKADTAAVYQDRGVLSAEEIRQALADSPDSGFANIDVDNVPETDDFSDVAENVDMDDEDKAGSVFDEAMSLDYDPNQPRDNKGQFSETEGRTSGGSVDDSNQEKDISQFLQEEIKGVKGLEAIKSLMDKKSGFVRSAFHREDMGDIALFYGDVKRGLAHIINHRENQHIDVDSFLKDITDVVEKGEIIRFNKDGRYEIFYNKKMAIVEPKVTNGKITFLLTAFKRRKP